MAPPSIDHFWKFVRGEKFMPREVSYLAMWCSNDCLYISVSSCYKLWQKPRGPATPISGRQHKPLTATDWLAGSTFPGVAQQKCIYIRVTLPFIAGDHCEATPTFHLKHS
ncbi:hypothetical protein E2C01_043711 [Portunus trituberculatus]|uniref:Uncharacterized protein n=1 Tax=Portunus trituberculatus TaxID=210409 RepID=A0A5B7FX39_PORTR|nr:hypothetical protein [Portunus trituberculatus]